MVWMIPQQGHPRGVPLRPTRVLDPGSHSAPRQETERPVVQEELTQYESTNPFVEGNAARCLTILISTTVGLFGFVETTTATLWWETLWVEIAAIVVLGVLFVVARGRRT